MVLSGGSTGTDDNVSISKNGDSKADDNRVKTDSYNVWNDDWNH